MRSAMRYRLGPVCKRAPVTNRSPISACGHCRWRAALRDGAAGSDLDREDVPGGDVGDEVDLVSALSVAEVVEAGGCEVRSSLGRICATVNASIKRPRRSPSLRTALSAGADDRRVDGVALWGLDQPV